MAARLNWRLPTKDTPLISDYLCVLNMNDSPDYNEKEKKKKANLIGFAA